MDTFPPDNSGRRPRPTKAKPPNWRQRLLIIAAVLAAALVTAGVAISATRGNDPPTAVGEMTATSKTGQQGATAAAAIGQPGEALLIDQLYAVAAITEQPHRFGSQATATSDTPMTTGQSGGLPGRTITIDAGHASNPDLSYEATGPASSETKVKDPGGTSGAVTGQPEYLVNLSLAINLKQQLEAAGATVIMTRSGDSFDGGNIERAGIANSAGSDLFIRIHCDGSTDQGTHGASTLYPALIPGWTDDIYTASRQAAQAVQAGLVTATGALDNGIVERGDMTGFNWADVPAILVEVGYLTNPAEDSALATPEYQQEVARGLLEGIRAYFQ
jgi:N-acetylmuramoyl-L-alanine amidase